MTTDVISLEKQVSKNIIYIYIYIISNFAEQGSNQRLQLLCLVLIMFYQEATVVSIDKTKNCADLKIANRKNEYVRCVAYVPGQN